MENLVEKYKKAKAGSKKQAQLRAEIGQELESVREDQLKMRAEKLAGFEKRLAVMKESLAKENEAGAKEAWINKMTDLVIAEDGEPCNDVIIEGPLCKEPIYRRTPLGREICDAMLAVPRSFRRADYLPCIFWGRTAEEISICHTGDRIRIIGRLQSRTYIKRTEDGQKERVAYEISALSAQILEQEM